MRKQQIPSAQGAKTLLTEWKYQPRVCKELQCFYSIFNCKLKINLNSPNHKIFYGKAIIVFCLVCSFMIIIVTNPLDISTVENGAIPEYR